MRHCSPPQITSAFLLTLALLGNAFPAALAHTPPHAAPMAMNKQAFSARSLDGRLIDIASRKGWKVVYFWSATCPCVRNCENLTLLPLARQYKGKVAFFAVAANNFDFALSLAEFRQEADTHHLPYPLLLDRTHALTAFLHARVTPHTFVLNPRNQIVFAGMPDDSTAYETRVGKQGLSQTYLARALAECLAGKKVKQPRTEVQGCLIDR